ncbi:GGDEF domain-containing protein [Marinobacter salexigens]|uniref:GGDEF domain-containing protein n=1 Tax=Marinobacter salexigens TaxID=1925763 RepID=UPI000C285F27|nr:GGDEF domain-containing protein [Marinobacter salexigens]
MLNRLKTDFQLSIITLLGTVAFLGITPFVVLRIAQGNVVAGIVDVLILACIGGGMLYAWVTGDTRRVGFVMAWVVCFGAVAAGAVGQADFFWLYPCLMVAFFLVSSRVAVLVSLSAIVTAMVIRSDGLQSAEHLWSFFSTTIMTCICAFVFAFRNEQHRKSLELLATVDPLTGVKNRRSMDEGLAIALADAKRTSRSYGLIMIDLDHFKKINDKHGHSVGDEVLLDLVALVQKRIRSTDQLYRYGGEEFVLLLSDVNARGVEMMVNDLQRIIRQQLMCRETRVTASFGVALLRHNESAADWLQRADAALYLAKEAGRDQVVFSDNEPVPLAAALVGSPELAT